MENGGIFVKKWTFPQRRVHYVQYQYFLFYILLIWGGGCVRTQRTPICLRAWYIPHWDSETPRDVEKRRYAVYSSDLVVVDTELVGVGGERVHVHRAGGVVEEAAAAHADAGRRRSEDVDQQAGAGVHGRVAGERAVVDRDGAELADERQTALVGVEQRRPDRGGDARQPRDQASQGPCSPGRPGTRPAKAPAAPTDPALGQRRTLEPRETRNQTGEGPCSPGTRPAAGCSYSRIVRAAMYRFITASIGLSFTCIIRHCHSVKRR